MYTLYFCILATPGALPMRRLPLYEAFHSFFSYIAPYCSFNLRHLHHYGQQRCLIQ